MEKLNIDKSTLNISCEELILYQNLVYLYQNNLILGNDKMYKELRKIILILGIIGITTLPITEKVKSLVNNSNFKLMYENYQAKNIQDILNNNNNLDQPSKEIIYEFTEKVGSSFDLTLFKANLEELKIIYLNNNDYADKKNKNGVSNNSVAFFDVVNKTIYVNENYDDSIYHELFHLVNNYYDDEIGFIGYCNDKGKALLEAMNARFTDMYFQDNSYIDERKYLDMLIEIFDEATIRHYFENGKVEDTISDLSDLYGDELLASNLITLMDENLNNKDIMDYESYNANQSQIMELLQNYFFGSQEVKIKELLELYNDETNKDKISKLILKVYLTKCDKFMNYYDNSQIETFDEKKINSLVTVYNDMKNYNIYSTKEEFLEDLNEIKDIEASYDYEDIKDCLVNKADGQKTLTK